MSDLRSRRPLTLDRADLLNGNPTSSVPSPVTSPPPTNLSYVLRRYGGLNVFVPNFTFGPVAANHDGASSPLGRLHHHPLASSQCPQQRPVLNSTETMITSSESNEFLRLDNLEGRPTQIRDPYGKFTPLFGGRIVLGTGKGVFVTSLLFFAALITNIAFQKQMLFVYCGGLPIYITGLVLGAVTVYFFLIISVTDPGVVPKNYSLDELLAETEEYRAKYPDERYFRYCNKCKTCRPPRTFHCSVCEICIRQQDTHLWAGGTCVGERNRRSYFFYVLFQTLLGAYLLATSLLIAPHLVRGIKGYSKELVQMLGSTIASFGLLFFPQSGLFMLIYKIYLTGVGRTAREEYRKYHCYDTNDCVVDKYPVCLNIRNFFCRRSFPSVFRRRRNRIDPEGVHVDMPDPWILEETIVRRRPRMRDSRDLIEIPNFIEPEVDEEDILNGNTEAATNENVDTVRLREVANYARGKSTPSVPLFEHGLNSIMTRIKMPRRSKPSSILQQQINAFHKAAKIPKSTVSYHKRQKLPVSLSDGCIPRTKDGVQEMIQLSRATQLRRIIQMILLRDREGLIEMSNRVNIAALVGMNRFDPDNLQLLELNNGLPMIAPRRREPELGNHRLGAGVLGIPQMVAAGLLPTARDLATSVETMVGRGRVRRMPPVGRQRYTPITVVGGAATATPGGNINQATRRVLNMDVDQVPPTPPSQTQVTLQNQFLSAASLNNRAYHQPHQMLSSVPSIRVNTAINAAQQNRAQNRITSPLLPPPPPPTQTLQADLMMMNGAEEDNPQNQANSSSNLNNSRLAGMLIED